MIIPIIKIGNSKGIILSKTILKEYDFAEKAELIMKENHIELKPVSPPRQNWDKAFKRMHELGEDKLLDQDVLEDDATEEWEWE